MCGFGAAYKGVHQDTPSGGRHLGGKINRFMGVYGFMRGFYGLWEFDEGVLRGE